MISQLVRFGCVGGVAAAVHLAVVALLVMLLAMSPLLANVAGFGVAFQVTYFGHRQWTFRVAKRNGDYRRMLLVSLAAFALNELMYAVLLQTTSLDYRLALGLVLVAVAGLTFIGSRVWVFTHAS
ncbi:MAG: GtrA family protein [Verrucomicrobiota bacterium]